NRAKCPASQLFSPAQPRQSSSRYVDLARSLITRGVNDVERHGQEKVADENGERSVDHRFGGGATDADRALARGQSFVATDEDNQNAEANCVRQTHNDVAAADPAHQV